MHGRAGGGGGQELALLRCVHSCGTMIECCIIGFFLYIGQVVTDTNIL